jgi:uncharacterized protein with von Willebrand factor type A (vWA) domain
MTQLVRNLLLFGRTLRAAGLDVHLGRMLDVLEALAHVDAGARDEVYHTCRTLLVHRHDDLATFDRVFEAFWTGQTMTPATDGPTPPGRHDGSNGSAREDRQGGLTAMQPIGDALDGDQATGALRTWSDIATLAQKDFAEFTDDELAIAAAALDRLRWQPGHRRTRRWVAGRGPRIDIRRALARSLRTGGDVVGFPRRVRRMRPRPLVVLCDVSGSMERYSRMLLQFVHALGHRHRRVEAFLFSTHLERITPELRTGRLDVAVAAIGRHVTGWSGGTRIGEALRELHLRWRRRVLHGGPVVLLISDGWDRGEPAVLRAQAARLQRSCYRLVWLNPLIGTPDYAPLTRGLQAALPYVDDFLPVRTLTNLADLAVHLDTLTTR